MSTSARWFDIFVGIIHERALGLVILNLKES